MADHTLTTTESSVFQKYAPAIFSALIAAGVGSEGLHAVGLSLTSGLQFAALVASTILVFIVPIVGAKWQGLLKTGFEVVSVVATVAIPFIVNGHIDKSQWILVGVAVLKALATEFGVQIRPDATVTNTPAPVTVNAGVPTGITSLPDSDQPADPADPEANLFDPTAAATPATK